MDLVDNLLKGRFNYPKPLTIIGEPNIVTAHNDSLLTQFNSLHGGPVSTDMQYVVSRKKVIAKFATKSECRFKTLKEVYGVHCHEDHDSSSRRHPSTSCITCRWQQASERELSEQG